MISKIIEACRQKKLNILYRPPSTEKGEQRVHTFTNVDNGLSVTIPDRMLDDCSPGNIAFYQRYVIKKITICQNSQPTAS